ncbi:glycoside hydrolase family 3 protein [Anaerocolumna xylanovorans]|uniref:beta-N-acetylhexosaminidase n=1 Tax=Anaerocolumna xylanovorans DSM 12503 TaxID=1121345 RepID=A0A1M7XX48_9FIRM|nr:glycoside hydrolase family 3 N-terminal domain-containing protein [Anaerocolumna xylanovorans]SHO43455.1 beta-N-acetylhexosaminidase [Anaerocolumna xylanovorans DSM 12503]
MKSHKSKFVCLLLLLTLFITGCSRILPSAPKDNSPVDTVTPAPDTDDNSGNTEGTGEPATNVPIPSINMDDNTAEGPTGGADDSDGTDVTSPVSGNGTVSQTPTDIPSTGSPTDNSSSNNGTKDSDSYEARATEIASDMTLAEKVGQMFFVRLRKDTGIKDVSDYRLGGYILFGDDFKDETKTSIKKMLNSYQEASSIPMLIGVDEEGGTVNRLSKYSAFRSSPFESPIDLYKKGGFEAIQADTKEKADLLLSLGINVNLAPVSDVSTNPSDFIYKRSFGKDAKATANYVKTVVLEMKQDKIGSTLKHFPGYGNNVDTHTGVATDTRKYEQFVKNDFLPFEAGIKAGADSILVSHNIVTCLDKDHPASLSSAVHDVLRDTLGFEGVIMTDDLSMDAIKDYTSDDNAAVLAIKAGNDLLIASNFDTQIPAVLDALKKGTIKEERIDASVIRILIWKLRLGILQ